MIKLSIITIIYDDILITIIRRNLIIINYFNIFNYIMILIFLLEKIVFFLSLLFIAIKIQGSSHNKFLKYTNQ